MWFHHRLPAFAVAVLSGSACGGFLYDLLVLTGRIGVVNGALWRYPELSGLPGWIGADSTATGSSKAPPIHPGSPESSG